MLRTPQQIFLKTDKKGQIQTYYNFKKIEFEKSKSNALCKRPLYFQQKTPTKTESFNEAWEFFQ